MTMERTDEAMGVAGILAAEVVYAAVADAVSTAIRYCSMHATPLDDDQAMQLVRATLECCDGVHDKLAEAIDQYGLREIERRGLS